MNDSNHELPRGWIIAPLSSLIAQDGVLTDGDWVESKDQDPAGDVRLVQLADVGDGVYVDKSNRFMTSEKAALLNCTYLKPSDLLISRLGEPLGKTCIFPGDTKRAVTVVDVCICRPGNNDVDARWLMHFLNSPAVRREVAKFTAGTTRKRISGKNLRAIQLHVPPPQEQHRISFKIDELFSQIDEGERNLKRVQTLLKQYRQSVLKAAVTGELTKDWRAKNKGKGETGADLLKRILVARREAWEASELTKLKAKGKAPKNDDWKKKYVEPAPPDTSNLPDLPEGWVWVTLEQVALIDSGQTPTDIESFTSPAGEIPWFKVSSMNEPGNEIELTSSKWRFDRSVALDRGLNVFPRGSIVFPKLGGALLTNKRRVLGTDAAIDLNTMAVSPMPEAAGLLWLFFAGIDLGKLSSGSVVPQLKKSDVSPLTIPLAGSDELIFLVSEANDRLASIERLQEEVGRHARASNGLRQSILRAAFSGQLVPQDPSDEPIKNQLSALTKEQLNLKQLESL